MKNHKITPYLLPILTTLFIISIFLITKPNITGFTTFQQTQEGDITIRTYTNSTLPENSIILISLNDQEETISAKEFIESSGSKFEYKDGGYTGDYEYKININKFNFNIKENNNLSVKIIHNNKIISESSANF